MKLQNLTIIFIIIVLPVILLTSFYIATGLKTIRYQGLYETGLITATQDAIQAFEINTLNNKYSDNPETKRSIIKSSIKMFETSLGNTCNISTYNKDDIEEYIPAIMFGMQDGFYLYAPSYNPTSGRYEHSLKNYVYYAETLDKDKGIIIRYYLDSYVHVSGNINGTYQSKEGYLINIDKTVMQPPNTINPTQISYYGTNIDMKDELAVNYFIDNYEFSEWFKYEVLPELGSSAPDYLQISEDNDPEDPNSKFAQHRNNIIRSKIEGVLNSTITAYSQRTWNQNYKMPELTEEDWEKIYSDISVTTFFQGKKIGFTKYNGYCVLNSNNHYELINPNLLYFCTDDDGNKKINTSTDYYHDIRCESIENQSSITIDIGDGNNITTLRGWKVGRFQKLNKNDDAVSYDPDNTELTMQPTYNKYSLYMYERAECACYECINGSVGNISIYDYIDVASGRTDNAKDFIKESYWTSLARERAKLHKKETKQSDISVEKKVNGGKNAVIVSGETVEYTITITNNAPTIDKIREIIDAYNPSNINIKVDTITFRRIKNDGRDSMETIGYTIGANGLKWSWGDADGDGIRIIPGEQIIITYNAVVTGTVDENIKNEVKVLPSYSDNYEIDEATCTIRKSGVTVQKLVNPSSVEYGEQVEYTIRIKNEGSYIEKIDIVDDWIDSRIVPDFTTVSYSGYEHTSGENKMSWSNITINPGQEINITFKANINGDIGDTITNWVRVYVPTTKETKIAEASISSSVVKKFDIKNTFSDYNVVLVLDRSSSMNSNDIKAVYAASKALIYGYTDSTGNYVKGIGEDKVRIIAFAQNPTEITENGIKSDDSGTYLSWFNMPAIGISTNYLGALAAANDMYSSNKNNYIIFMSDGGPTNNQSKVFSGTIETEEPSFGDVMKNLLAGGWSLISSIYGGWLELNWTGPNEYGFRLLITAFIQDSYSDLLGLAKSVWTNTIMPTVNDIKSRFELYTVYFNTGGSPDPGYGLAQMAHSGKSYNSSNSEQLYSHFAKIAKDILDAETPKTITCNTGIITLENYAQLSRIEIGEGASKKTFNASVLDGYLSVSGSDATVNLNNVKVGEEYIFKTNQKVTFIYNK